MKLQRINWLMDAPSGTKLEGFMCRIKRVQGYRTGTGDYGEWTLQDLIVSDPSGEIVLTLDGRQELGKEWEGAVVLFSAGEKDGKPTGLVAEDHTNKRKNETIRRVRAMFSAIMEEVPQDEIPEEFFQQGGVSHQRPGTQQRQQGNQGQQRPQERQQGQAQGQGQQRPQNQGQGGQQRQHQGQGQQRAQEGQQRQQGNQGQGQAQQSSQATTTGQQNHRREAPRPPTCAECLHELKKLAARVSVVREICFDAAVANAESRWLRHGIKTSQEGVGAESGSMFIEVVRRLPATVFERLPFDAYKEKAYAGPRLKDIHDEHRPPFPTDKPPEEVKRMEAEGKAAKAAAEAADRAAHQQRRAENEQAPQDGPGPDGPTHFSDNWEKDDEIPF